MTQYSGQTGDGLAAARATLAAGDRALGDADHALAEVLGGAFQFAVSSIRRIEAVQSEIDQVGENTDIDTHMCARLLLQRHRELIDTVTAARDYAAVKSIDLQRLHPAYTQES